MLTPKQLLTFNTFGFIILKNFFNEKEVTAIRNEYYYKANIASTFELFNGTKRQVFDMTGDDTPFFASLFEDERLLSKAEQIHGKVLPQQIQADRHTKNTYWHHDVTGWEWKGIKFAFYLDAMKSDNGALRVIPGSHLQPWHDYLDNIKTLKYKWVRKNNKSAASGQNILEIPGYACETTPRDVILFDLRIYHASYGGSSDRHMGSVSYANYPTTSQELCMTIFHAIPNLQDHDNSEDPWNPTKFMSDDWWKNKNGNKKRQVWINEWKKFSKMDSSETGYNPVPKDGRIIISPIK